jgi:acyl-CoA synthetase (AMP-forming)/AMP-acid ligase II
VRSLTAEAGFVDRLAAFGEAPALLTGEEVVSYADLDARIDATLGRLGTERRLVLLHGRNTLESVVTYLAALRGRHPVILVDAARSDQVAELQRRFDPDVVIGRQGWQERRLVSAHALHPDLRLLLSTSGSTGSPKLVRLSAANLASNAAAIAGYLGLRPADRAVTSLPLAYSYGLSVLHSHLEVGASVVLTERSVVEPAFWSLARSRRVTSFAAVPHTFRLLDRGAEPWYEVPSLRYVTSAGGRLDPAEVRRLAGLGRRHGWELYVMYGQTEATARMAYLDPADNLAYPECIGRAIPGGSLRVDQAGVDGVGELVYSGPNVMMGYAEAAADLAGGPALAELRTGDLGREHPGGLLQVVGRTSRFAKLLGHRVDLDRVQSELAAFDPTLVCLSDDERLLVAVTTADPLLVRDAASRLTGLPPGLVSVRQYAALPLLPNGKPDFALLRQAAPPAEQDAGLEQALRTAYAEVLGYDRVDPDASFVRLGGDSLSFVEVAFRLEELLGRLPAGWPELSIRELAASPDRRPATAPVEGRDAEAEPTPSTPRRGRRPRWGGWARLDTSLVLRALAIVLVVQVHLGVTPIRGGAHLLLAVAGYTFARFPLSAVRTADTVRPLVASIARLAVPSVLYIALVVACTGGYSLANVVLLNHVLGPPHWTETWNFWFVEALVAILGSLALLLAVPAARRLERQYRLLLPTVLLVVGLLLRPDVLGSSEATMRYGRPGLVFWLFALGWLIQASPGTLGRLLTSALVLVALAGYFPTEPLRGVVVQVGLLLLIWLPVLAVPRLLAPRLRRLAAASLWIYLTHWVVWPALQEAGVPPLAIAAACLGVGVIAAAAVSRLEKTARRRLVWTSIRPRSAPLPVSARWRRSVGTMT